MQSVNDDMDELFRQAAEHYPLNTTNADWNKVQSQLGASKSNQQLSGKPKRDRKLLWLLLLLPIGFVCGRYVGLNESRLKDGTSRSATKFQQKKEGINQVQLTPANPSQNKAPEVSNTEDDKEQLNLTSSNNTANKAAENNARNLAVTTNKEAEAKTAFTTKKKNKRQWNDDYDSEVTTADDNSNNHLFKKRNQAKPTSISKNKTFSAPVDPLTVAVFRPSANKNIVDKVVSSTPLTATFNNRPAKDESSDGQHKKFYYALITGPDITTVKFEQADKIGYSAGLLLGYRINHKLAVETGVLFDRKKYYVNGEYLDSGKLQLPMHSYVLYGRGDCFMVEMPVNIKYNLITKTNHQWFAGVGVSSYFMEKEDYTVTYKRYNQQYEKSYNYGSESKDWFSILNVSAGFQKNWGKYSSIRIEPYLKLPLKKLGEQDLHITSTGIHVVISHVVH